MAIGRAEEQSPSQGKLADAPRDRPTVLTAAAEVFAIAGVDAPIRRLHTYFLDRLLPSCTRLLDAAVEAGDIRPGTQPYELTHGIGNLCIGDDDGPRCDPDT